MSIYDDPDGFSDWMNTRNKESGDRRKTIYKKGETIRTYKNRTLHIHHPQTETEWRKASKKRRSQAQKNAVRSRSLGYEYADPFGLTSKQRRETDYWLSQERKKEARKIGVEEMRAILKDDHWEEVCGHSRWKWDKQSTIKEYHRYLRDHRFMY